MRSNTDTDMSNRISLDDLVTGWNNYDNNDRYEHLARSIITALEENGSDSVRKVLSGIKEIFAFPFPMEGALGNMFEEKMKGMSGEKKINYMLGVPFFCLEPSAEASASTSMMSGATCTSKACRKCTREFLQFQVHFDKFDMEEVSNGLRSLPAIDYKYVMSMHQALAHSVTKSLTEDPAKLESAEVSYTFTSLNYQLSFFLYKFKQSAVPDIKIMKNISEEDVVVLCGEAKQVKHLPQKLISGDLSAHLCRYGFATKIARNAYDDQTEKKNAKRLTNFLRIKKARLVQNTAGLREGQKKSNMVNDMLQLTPAMEEKMTATVDEVVSSRDGNKIGKHDALNLWCATMQACEVSVINRMRFTVVMSARMMWFVKLDIVGNDKCTVKISGSMLIGESGFLEKLVRFIALADDSDEIPDQELAKWKTDFYDKNNGSNSNSGRDSKGKDDDQDNDNRDIKDEDKGDNEDNDNREIQDEDKDDNEDNDKDDSFDHSDNLVAGEKLSQWVTNFSDKNGGANLIPGPGSKDKDDNKDGYNDDTRDVNSNNNGRIKRRRVHDSNTKSDEVGQMLSNSLVISQRRPPNISRAVSADNSSSQIKTRESPTRIIEPADGFTNNIVSPGMDTTIKSVSMRTRKSKRMTNEEQMMWQRALTGLGNAGMKYLDLDQDGVTIPYLHQLEGVEVESLGNGRCGTVKKIRWNNGFAAMKEYVLEQADDDRIPFDVYEHELKVFYRLKSLWGHFVPHLLFHSPWSCRPSIGMEVGQPMDHDFDKWTEADKEKMKKTIAKIEEKGFRQDDCEARNFVRLKNGSIAMIDFEEVVEISS